MTELSKNVIFVPIEAVQFIGMFPYMPELVGVAGGCFTEVPLDKPSYSVSHAKKYTWLKVPFGVRKLK